MNINTKSKIKIAMFALMLSFIVPQVTFAFLGIPCLNPFSDSNKPATFWNCTGTSNDSTVDASFTGNNANTSNTTNANAYSGKGIASLFDLFQYFMSRALVLLISLAVIWFVWNVFRYVVAPDEIDKAVAKDRMVWGIIAIFVMVSVWGLVAILQYTFQIFPSGAGPNVKSIMPTF